MFESYKAEMEKYLDFITDGKKKAKKAKSKAKKTKKKGDPLVVRVGKIKQQFESLESPEVATTDKIKQPLVGKLDTAKIFESAQPSTAPAYVPVVIDKASACTTFYHFTILLYHIFGTTNLKEYHLYISRMPLRGR